MNRTWITKGLTKSAGRELVNISQVAAFVGINRQTAREWLAEVDYLKNGNEKLYSVDDVAEMMMQRVNA